VRAEHELFIRIFGHDSEIEFSFFSFWYRDVTFAVFDPGNGTASVVL